MRKIVLLLLLSTLVATSDGFSYSRPRFLLNSEIVQSRWTTPTAHTVIVNTDTPNLIVFGSQPFEAVRNAFEMRSAYSSVRFAPVPGSSPESVGFDGTSLVTFKDTPTNRSFTAGFGAATSFWTQVLAGEIVVTESDIAFSPDLPHTTTGSNALDIEGLCAHEIDHFLSLEHSAVMGSTGWPNFYFMDTTKRSLALDDVAGTEFLYPFPDTASRTGALSGTVTKQFILTPVPVFGAHVVAIRQSDGAVVSDVSVTDGEWRIDALPPGDYTLYSEPFDGPYWVGLIDDGIYGSTAFELSLVTEFAGGNATPTVYSVTAGGEISGININHPNSAPDLNPRWVGLSPGATTPVFDTVAVPVTQGDTVFLTVAGFDVDQVPDDGLSITGPGVTVSSSGVVRGTSGQDDYMIVEVTADADAAPVTRSILVDDGSRVAAISGGLEVLRANPLPGLLRNDDLTALSPVTPALSAIFQPGNPSLEPLGPDNYPGIGEGLQRETTGSDDDDDLYVPEVPSGYLDPDLDVLSDVTRPLVFYQLTDPAADLRLVRTSSGRIQIVY